MAPSHPKRLAVSFVFTMLLAVVVGGVVLAGKPPKDPPPPPTPIVATTTDRNFLEVDVDQTACQVEFLLAVDVSGEGTHYRYKVGPASSTDPYDDANYSAPIEKSTPVSFELTEDEHYVLCLQGLLLDKRGRIKGSQPLNEATAYYWAKDTPPVEYRVTFTGCLEPGYSSWALWSVDTSGTAVGSGFVSDGSGGGIQHATRWTLEGGLEDISALDAPWFDLETEDFVSGWEFSWAFDSNEAGQMTGRATDGFSMRACVYDPLLGFSLLPRSEESPYDEGDYYIGASINENGEVIGRVNLPGGPTKSFLWTPTNPGTIHVIEPAVDRTQYPGGIGNGIFCVHDMEEPYHYDYYVFQFNSSGELSYELFDTVVGEFWGECINDNGAIAYGINGETTNLVKLYLQGEGSVTVLETTAEFDSPVFGHKANNSNDFMYNLDNVPYLYRYSEKRSYRLYDLADGYTKSVLFESSNGKLKTTGIYYGVVSDDNFAGTPAASPFDTIVGSVEDPDLIAGVLSAIALTPVPKL